MVSLRFPFSFWQSRLPQPHSSRPFIPFAAAVATVGVAAGAAAVFSSHENALKVLFSSDHSLPLWGSLSLADNSVPMVESKTGVSFPSVLEGSQELCGIGLRKKSILGLKNIDVYAFGVYADSNDIKKYLVEKYGTLSTTQLKGNKEFSEDLLENDISMTIRLQIVYSKLSIRSVRSAFEESVGSRLRKYGKSESENKELLQRFTSQFKDEIKIPRGAVIHLSKEKGHILRTSIDGQEMGSIQSKLLCRSVLDLYIGEQPFDKRAKEDIEFNMASYLQK